MQSVYIETSIIGYLATRLSSELITAGNQRLTQAWWADHRHTFDLFVSQAVIDECSAGDPTAARERLLFLSDLPVLEVNQDTVALADALLRGA